jgi:glucosyl-3-phosphoglycerate synthase
LIRLHHHSEFPLELLLEHKREPVTVVLPTREVADTIGPIVERLQGLGGLVDQVLVVDSASADGSAGVAAGLGAEVHQEGDLMPQLGPVRGKGDAMYRALSVARGELVAYLDSDTRGFSAHFATGMLGPLLTGSARFVKGAFRRPFATAGGAELPADGGRVTELMARPLLNMHWPQLAGFVQPLGGEYAARRGLLEQLPFPVGYGVELGMLVDALHLVGLDGLAQVDVGVRKHRHQDGQALGRMAAAIYRTAQLRLARGHLVRPSLTQFERGEDGFEPRTYAVDTEGRPPMAEIAEYAERKVA